MRKANIQHHDPRLLWEARYTPSPGRNALGSGHDPWLERWLPVLDAAHGRPLLDLGCGNGQDSARLAAHGHCVMAADLSRQALRACGGVAPKTRRLLADIRDPLPFRDRAFVAMVASLSLHYHGAGRTGTILREVRRCLADDGLLLARFNSTHDQHYGASGYEPVEPGVYLVDGELKRFFDRAAVEDLFRDGWAIRNVEEMTITRYNKPKVVWEAVVEKTA